jgi:predicted peroxiredoxin
MCGFVVDEGKTFSGRWVRQRCQPSAWLVLCRNNLMAQQWGVIWACTPCVRSRGYEQTDMFDGVVITGANVMHAEIMERAATLSF